MNMLFWIAALATGLLMPAARAKADYEVMTRSDIFFAEHDGVKLLGDFYAPKGLDKAPVRVAVHKWATASSIRTGGPISPKTATLCSQSSTG